VDSPPADDEADAPVHPMIRGQDIVDRYRLAQPSEHIIYRKDDLYNAMFEELFENDKIVFRKISGEGLMAVVDEDDLYCFSTLIPCTNIQHVAQVDRSGIPDETDACQQYTDPYYALALVNSTLMDWYYQTHLSDDLSVVPKHIERLPIAEIDFDTETQAPVEEAMELYEAGLEGTGHDDLLALAEERAEGDDTVFFHDLLSRLARRMSEFNDELARLNLNLLDDIGTNYPEGDTLVDVARYQPVPGVGEGLLSATTETHDKLRVGELSAEVSGETVVVEATVRYKPENETEYDEAEWTEPDQWGYIEMREPIPALEIRGLDEVEREFVRDFLETINERDDGFAGFYESATKTISPLDRIKAITLPALDAVIDDYEPYLRRRRRAEELRQKADLTDSLIDHLVYTLYELSEEERKVVEDDIH
jgi:hypothetical protein